MSLAIPAVSIHANPLQVIRVMVVDDSVVVRGLVSRWLDEEPGIKVVASLRTGREAVDHFDRFTPDVVLLDIEMPDLDGLSALPLLLQKDRNLIVIMASTLTRHNAEASFKAMSLGAADYIPKPETNRGVTTSAEFRRELIEKVRHLGSRRKLRTARHAAPAPAPPRPESLPSRGAAPAVLPVPSGRLSLRPFGNVTPRVLLIGSSTGGPQALNAVMGQLGAVIDRAAVLITQHMPATFTTILAEHLARASHRRASEAVDHEPIVPGRIYVAPGGRHMRVARRDGAPTISLEDGALINFCKPSVDPLFSSAAEMWGAKNLAVVLTGMGTDGTN
ncbi:MAG TPA: chemotaxis-specific protein-glutamate methyltransferase CheB, partial [Xanthobacteraceae bacterium]|nr:chemotaxis-specific protein-glutamate methyltransferase CheB [Xanthobacteraceae bacterium]